MALKSFISASQACSPLLTPISSTSTSRYLIGHGHSPNNFFDVMQYCMSLGGYTVHINSYEEHEDMKNLIQTYAGNVKDHSLIKCWTKSSKLKSDRDVLREPGT